MAIPADTKTHNESVIFGKEFYMKRLIIAIPVCLLIGFGACTKTKGPANGNSVQTNNNLDTLVNFSALVNKLSWRADSVYGYLVHQSGNDSGKVNLLINAYGTNYGLNNTVTFTINNFRGLGTYDINPPYVSATLYVGKARHFATSGQIIVNSNTAYGLIGTFNFVADTFTMTNGEFNVAQP